MGSQNCKNKEKQRGKYRSQRRVNIHSDHDRDSYVYKTVDKFLVLLANVDTLTNEKLSELLLKVKSMDVPPVLIALQEVKPKNFKYDRILSEYNLDGYEMLHKNLAQKDPGRGMIVYIREDCKYTQVTHGTDFDEYLSLELTLSVNVKLLFTSVYRSPSLINNEKLCQLLKEISQAKCSHIVTVGDCNMPYINWESYSTPTGPGDINFEFIECIRDCFWSQHVTEPTRGRGDTMPSLLNLVFSNEEDMISDIKVLDPIGKSDHSVVMFNIDGYKETPSNKTRLDFSKADFAKMKKILDIDWSKELNDKTVENQWNVIKDKLNDAITDSIPQKVIKNRNGKYKKTIFISKKMQRKMRRKEKLWRKYRSTGDASTFEQYKRVRNQVRRMSRQSVKNHERDIAASAKENPKKFWAYVKSKSKTKSSITDLYKDDNKEGLTVSDKEKANVLGHFFASVFTVDPQHQLPEITCKNVPIENKVIISPEIVKRKLDDLVISKSPGPDGIHPRILKELSDTLTTPLYILFKNSLKNGVLPSEWEKANITAIYKKGEKKKLGTIDP